MRRIRRFVRLVTNVGRLDWAKRRAVVRAGGLLLLARASLAILPFPTVLRLTNRPRRGAQATGSEEELKTMVWAVKVVGNHLFPTNPCLPQAVVVQRHLRRDGRPAQLRISVRKDREGKFGAHAWVESAGVVVIGGEILSEEFVPLPPVHTEG